MTTRLAALDYIKFPLACFVVLLHASGIDGRHHLDFLLVNGLFRIAVPMFVMMSGFFFFRMYAEGRSALWFRRVGILYLFWMMIYSPFWIRGLAADFSFLKLLNLWVAGYYHLWFLPGIMLAGLCLLFLLRQPKAVRWAVMCLGALAGIVLQYATFFEVLPLPVEAFRNGIFFCLPFFGIGFALARSYPQGGFNGVNAGSFVLPCLLALLLESALAHRINPAAQSLDILVSLYALCPVILLSCLRINVASASSAHVAAAASLIYFVHIGLLIVIAHIAPAALSFSWLTGLSIAGLVCAGYALAVRLGMSRYLRHIC